MTIPGISSNDPVSLARPAGSNQEVDRDAFMRLLVTQMEHQDPLNPAANEDFIAQLANFSSLDQLEQLNENVVAMITLNQSNALLSQLTQSSALIGRTVQWTDPATGQTGSGQVDSVRVEEGFAFLQIDGREVPLASVSEILSDGMAAMGDSEDGTESGEEA